MRYILLFILIGLAPAAQAYEYHLQFNLPSGARDATIAAYSIDATTVTGTCSFTTYSPCSGRACRPRQVRHDQTCTWDLYGNLLGTAAGAPQAPLPLYESGTEIVYATNGTSTAGHDVGNFGFVDTPSVHYTWQTPSGGSAVIADVPTLVSATLLSDGDFDLNFASASATASAGSATVDACPATVPVGSTCTVTIVYDPTAIACTLSPYGYEYPSIDLSLVTDAVPAQDFTARFTVTGVPICDD